VIKRALKQGIEGLAVGSGLATRLARGRRGRKLILAFHNIVPEQEGPWGEAALHLPATTFRAHLEVVAELCEIVPLQTLLSAPGLPDTPPQVAITFDDAYHGAVEATRNTLIPNRIPVTIFAPPGLLGSGGFWWDRLAVALGGDLPASVRSHCLSELAGRQDAVLSWARGEGLTPQDAPGHARPAEELDLLEIAESGSVFIESHTWSHCNLSALSDKDLHDELDRARQWIQERSMGPADVVAYPYGLGSNTVYHSARAVGHRDGLLVSGGWLPADETERESFAVPRLNVPSGLTAAGLRMRLAGLRL